MTDESMVFWFIPSLVATLLNKEREAGRPLTEAEVIRIRDQANVVMTPRDIVPKLEAERGYRDIDPERCWEEWQAAREELLKRESRPEAD